MIDIIISVFGWLATAILVFSTIPQAVRTLRTQETSSLSLWMLILALTSGTLFVIYGTLVCIYTSVIILQSSIMFDWYRIHSSSASE